MSELPTMEPPTEAKPKKKAAAKKARPAKDLIVETASQIENLNKEAALEMGRVIQADTDFNLFRIGGILSVVRANQWYDAHETFQAYVEAEFPTLSRSPYRKARYLMAIYGNLIESGVKWEQVASLGWTKLTIISDLLSPENVEEWVETASSMTVLQLQKHKKALGGGSAPSGAPTESSTEITTLTFKVHPDQKENVRLALEKAKAEFGTEYDAVALDHIVMGYLTGSLGKAKKSQPPSLAAMMQKVGPEAALETYGEVFPNVMVDAKMIEDAPPATVDDEGTVEVQGSISDDVIYEEEV